jgi:YgiT-type zinc finger domain-containing protein
MKCVICKKAETQNGKAPVTLERGRTILVVKGVPAPICPNCGEEYVDEAISAELLKTAEEAARAGIEVGAREFVTA